MIESILADPPNGVEIRSNIDVSRLEEYGISLEGSVGSKAIESLADRGYYLLNIPRTVPVVTASNLVHTISGIVPVCPNPWIATIEAPSSFYGLNDDWFLSPSKRFLLRKILKSRLCKGITCFSDATRNRFLRNLCAFSDRPMDASIDDKTKTLYPAVNPNRFVQAGKEFVSQDFQE